MTAQIARVLSRTDRAVLRLVQIAAWIGAALTAVTTALNATLPLLQGMGAAPLLVQPELPEPLAGPTEGIAVVSTQSLDTVVFLTGQPTHLTLAMVAALVARSAGVALVLVGIAMLAGRLLRGRAFLQAAQLPLALVLIGAAAGPIVADALEGWVSMGTWQAMGTPAGYGAVAAFNPAAIFFGLVVAALMTVFRVADRAERDADGLV
jgi:hypothetical protein